jgi:hypothetical protein
MHYHSLDDLISMMHANNEVGLRSDDQKFCELQQPPHRGDPLIGLERRCTWVAQDSDRTRNDNRFRRLHPWYSDFLLCIARVTRESEP